MFNRSFLSLYIKSLLLFNTDDSLRSLIREISQTRIVNPLVLNIPDGLIKDGVNNYLMGNRNNSLCMKKYAAQINVRKYHSPNFIENSILEYLQPILHDSVSDRRALLEHNRLVTAIQAEVSNKAITKCHS